MQIYPAIDIKNGQCVRLRQGKFEDITVYGDDPMTVAKRWVACGASYLHVVDLDGARQGTSYNSEIIRRICEKFSVPVQTGGGIRSMRDIEEKLALGVSRVILGTVAVENPELVRDAVKAYGSKIAVGIDAVNGRVAIKGWEQVSQISARDLGRKMRDFGVKTIVYTDIAKDGMMEGPNITATAELIRATGISIIASGGIASMADLENLERIGVQGTIIGKALYQGDLKLKEVISRLER